MTEASDMLAFGHFELAEQASLNEAASASAVRLHTTNSEADAAEWLEAHQVAAILLGEGDNRGGLALGTRAQSRHRQLPILALARTPSDLDFADAYSWGADDVVSPERAWSITTRLRALTRDPGNDVPVDRGTAVVGEVLQSRRIATARALFNAGYDVRFAVTPEDASAFAKESQVSLVVICTELCEDPAELISQTEQTGSTAKFVISAEPRKHNELSQKLAHCHSARVTDASAPPENVVFLANELAAGSMPDKRATPRILHGTTVRFRGEGREEDELGFSYNVSEGGLYIRTLAPPSDDIVWLELTPPKGAQRVRLVGEVAWRRPFGPHGKATVPPGFGVRIIDVTKTDAIRWTSGCQEAAAEIYTRSLLPPSDKSFD